MADSPKKGRVPTADERLACSTEVLIPNVIAGQALNDDGALIDVEAPQIVLKVQAALDDATVRMMERFGGCAGAFGQIKVRLDGRVLFRPSAQLQAAAQRFLDTPWTLESSKD